MSETSTSATNGPDAADMAGRSRLSFDLDVDIAVVGAGLAGLTVALEAARLGASVAVLEGRHIGWNASGHQLGTVMPGFGLPIGELIARIGFEDTRELWALSREGAEYVRATASEELIPGIALSEGALEVSNVEAGDQLISRLQMLGEDFETEVEGWQVDRVRAELKTDHYFHGVYYPRRFRSTAANTSMALPRWRDGRGRESSRTRRSSASIRRAFASASSRRRHVCARRTSCSPATSIWARRCGGCRRRCCRFGATPR
jgi:glycine/D-amino acid oxidase-like deaminating enzyme